MDEEDGWGDEGADETENAEDAHIEEIEPVPREAIALSVDDDAIKDPELNEKLEPTTKAKHVQKRRRRLPSCATTTEETVEKENG